MAELKGEDAMPAPAVIYPTAAVAAPANGQTLSAIEYVHTLPPDEKQAVFLALLREALQIHGDAGLLPIEDEDGTPFGYYVPPTAAKALSDQTWNAIPTEVRELLSRPVKNLDNFVSSDEMLTILTRPSGSPPQ